MCNYFQCAQNHKNQQKSPTYAWAQTTMIMEDLRQQKTCFCSVSRERVGFIKLKLFFDHRDAFAVWTVYLMSEWVFSVCSKITKNHQKIYPSSARHAQRGPRYLKTCFAPYLGNGWVSQFFSSFFFIVMLLRFEWYIWSPRCGWISYDRSVDGC